MRGIYFQEDFRKERITIVIAIKIYDEKEKVDVLRLSNKEAQRVSEILLNHANELNSKGDLMAAMLGSALEKCAMKNRKNVLI